MTLWTMFSNASLAPLIQRIGWTLVHSIWEGLAIGALLAITLRLFRNVSANKRYAACGLALLTTTSAVVLTFYFCAIPNPPSIPRAGPIPIASVEIPFPRPEAHAASPVLAPNPALQPTVIQTLVALWALGVVLLSIRHLGGWLFLLRLRKGNPLPQFQPVLQNLAERVGIVRLVRLLETTRLDVPAVIGFFRPIILIPVGILNDLSPQQIEAILAHELAHIRRHDYLLNLFQVALETLLFYHPALWWMSNRMRAERENCCDDIAADLCGDKRLYAAALAALEHRRAAFPIAAVALTGGDLLARVRRLLKLPPKAPAGYARPLAIVIIAFLCLAIPVVCFVFTAKHDKTINIAGGGAASSNHNDINILIGPQSMSVNGKRVDWTQLEGMLVALPQPQRSKTVLALAATSGDVTVDRYFQATNHLAELVKKYGLAYVSQTGIKPTTDPALDLPPGTEVGEYYMNGHIRRPGIYSLTGRKITLQQALVAAGGAEPGFEHAEVSVLRRDGDHESIALDVASVADLLEGHNSADYNPAFYLKPNDLVAVALPHPKVSTTQTTILNPPPDPNRPGEYYIDGEVPRTGVYNMTGRKITLKQALAAAGGLQKDPAGFVITVIRRDGHDKSSFPLERASANDLMQGRIPDLYLWPNDIIRVMPYIPPATTRAASDLSIEAIAAADATMREYIKIEDTMEFRVAQLRRNVGPGNRVLQDAASDLDLQKQRIDQYAAEYRKRLQQFDRNYAPVIPIAPAATRSKSDQPLSEYYIDGHIHHLGAYSLPAKTISLRQAIAAAGGFDEGWDDPLIEILRRVDGKESLIALVRFDAITSKRTTEPLVQPGDVIRVGVGFKSNSATTQPGAGLSLDDIAQVDPTMRTLLDQQVLLESQIRQIRQRNPGVTKDSSLPRVDLYQIVGLEASERGLAEEIQRRAQAYSAHLGPVYLDHAAVLPLTPQ